MPEKVERTKNSGETGCCPRFKHEPWNEKEFVWNEKLFLKDSVKSFLHIPLNFGKVITRNMKKLDDNNAKDPDIMVLSRERSAWGSDMYLAATKEMPGAKMERISGTIMTKTFEGPFKDAGKWAKEMDAYVKSKGKSASEMYFWYTTCPKCAKVYGKNHVVVLAKV